MSHIFKDHSREHKMARDAIKANTDLINKYSMDIQKDLSQLQEYLTIATWYIGDQMVQIDEHYEDAPLEHLYKINNTYSGYCGELVGMDTVVRQLLYLLNKYFDFDGEDIQKTTVRVVGDK